METHKVVIEAAQLSEYEAKGYRISADQNGWDSVMKLTGEFLYVVEISDTAHARLNKGEVAYALLGSYDRYEIVEMQVLDKDEHDATVARNDRDVMPFVVSPSDLYPSRRECAAGKAEYLRERVRELRRAADKVQDFIIAIECPPEK